MDKQLWFQKVKSQVTAGLQARITWLGIPLMSTPLEPIPGVAKDSRHGSSSRPTTKLLDYACGTGLVSLAFLHQVDNIRGIDISPNIVEVYNSLFSSSGVSPTRARAVVGNLLAIKPFPSLDEEQGEWRDFDVAIAGFSFRHFDDVQLAAKRLAERLRRKGVLVVFDLLSEPGMGKERDRPKHDLDVIKVFGFGEEEMRLLFEGAGLVDFDFDVLEEPIVVENSGKGMQRRCFFARGRKV